MGQIIALKIYRIGWWCHDNTFKLPILLFRDFREHFFLTLNGMDFKCFSMFMSNYFEFLINEPKYSNELDFLRKE